METEEDLMKAKKRRRRIVIAFLTAPLIILAIVALAIATGR